MYCFPRPTVGSIEKRVNMKQAQAMLASWGRSFAAAALAVYMTGDHNAQHIAMGGVAAILPVVMRYLNPNDAAFGRGAK